MRVWLKPKEREEIAELCRVIDNYTKPTDYIVCYPYAPTINFMTNRPSYEYNLYVDNAHNVSTSSGTPWRRSPDIGRPRSSSTIGR